MDQLTLWMVLGFLFAGYSVIANDSVQTLGTWIASNNQRFKWTTMWAAASLVLLFTLWYGCLLYTSPSPRDLSTSRMPSSA